MGFLKYNLTSKIQTDAAFMYLTELAAQGTVCEVKKVSPIRTNQQSRYLYLLLGAYGGFTGYTIDEAKTIFKREVNADLFVYEKNDQKFLKSTADLSTEDMSKAIDRFREASEAQGFPLPTAENQDWLLSVENEIARNKRL